MIKDKNEEITKNKKKDNKDYVFAVGRRRKAVARVRIYPSKESVSFGEVVLKKGDTFVNLKPIDQYFPGQTEKVIWNEPFRVTNTIGRYITSIRVEGGGRQGQLDAAIHGIARALELVDKAKFRPILKKKGMLERDSRARQRRMVGMGGKSRRKKQSPKR